MSKSRGRFAFPLAASAAAAVMLAAPSGARAEWAPVVHRSDAGAEVYLWSANRYGTSLSAIPFVQFDVSRNLYLNLRFPAAVSLDSDYNNNDAAVGLGNPTVSLYYSAVKRRLTWYVGGRVSAPFGLVDSDGWRYATSSAAASMALYDPYLWATDTLPFGGMGGIEYRFAPVFVLRAGGDLMFFPSLGNRRRYIGFTRSGEFGAELQGKLELEFQSRAGFGGGMALTTVWFPTDNYDNAQVAVMPYFAYDSQRTFFMRVGALLALDAPLGPAFDRGQVASIYLQLGGHIH